MNSADETDLQQSLLRTIHLSGSALRTKRQHFRLKLIVGIGDITVAGAAMVLLESELWYVAVPFAMGSIALLDPRTLLVRYGKYLTDWEMANGRMPIVAAQFEAFRIRAESNDDAAVKFLTEELTGYPDGDLLLVDSLRRMGGRAAANKLLEIIRDTKGRIRARTMAVEVVSSLDLDGAQLDLEEFLGFDEPEIRITAIEAIGRSGDSDLAIKGYQPRGLIERLARWRALRRGGSALP